LSGKHVKQAVFGKIAKIHRFQENLLQCALIIELSPINMISDQGVSLSALTWQGGDL
jgi:hypothetical protein